MNRTFLEVQARETQEAAAAAQAELAANMKFANHASELATRKRKMCDALNCDKGSVDNSGFCRQHGGGKRCQVPGCTKSAQGRSGCCKAHGGGKRCSVPGCTKSARGNSNTDKCKAHGGGRRCEEPSCIKSAIEPTTRCSQHGGGKRCDFPECTKGAADVQSGKCKAHGGGRRCDRPECTKSAASASFPPRCVAHGGGPRCEEPGCGKSALRGPVKKCRPHGGGGGEKPKKPKRGAGAGAATSAAPPEAGVALATSVVAASVTVTVSAPHLLDETMPHQAAGLGTAGILVAADAAPVPLGQHFLGQAHGQAPDETAASVPPPQMLLAPEPAPPLVLSASGLPDESTLAGEVGI